MTGKPVNLLLRIRIREGADAGAAADAVSEALGLERTGRPDPAPAPAAALRSRRAPAAQTAALPEPFLWSALMSYSDWRSRTELEPPAGTDAELWRISPDTFYLYHCSNWSTRIPAEPIPARHEHTYQAFFRRVRDVLSTLPVDVETLVQAENGAPRADQRTTTLTTGEPATKVRVLQHNTDPTHSYLLVDHPEVGLFAQRAKASRHQQADGTFHELAIPPELAFSPHDRETARIVGDLGDSFHDLADHYLHHRYPESALTWLATVAPTQGRAQDEPAAGLDPAAAGAGVPEAAARLGLDQDRLRAAVGVRALFGSRHGGYDPWDIAVTRPSRTAWAWNSAACTDRLDPHHLGFKYWLAAEIDRPGGRRAGNPADFGAGGDQQSTWHPAEEDEFVFPEPWRAPLHPRRGAVPTPIAPPWPGARRVADAAVREQAGVLARVRKSAEADGDLLAALAEFESDWPDPAGAAVQAALVLLRQTDGRSLGTAFADWWAVDHGLAFAACAAVELADLVVRDLGGGPGRIELRRDADRDVYGPQPFRSLAARVALSRVRKLLVADTELVYRHAVARLARHRRPGWARIAVSFLVPTQTEWMDECCADPGRVGAANGEARLLLLASISRPAQAVALDRFPLGRRHHRDLPVSLLHTLVDGMGPGCVPVLAGLLKDPDLSPGRAAERRAAEILAALPHDRAVAALLALSPAIEFSPLLARALADRPVRGLRLLADLAANGPVETRAAAHWRLTRHLAEHRDLLGPLLPRLPSDQSELAVRLLGEHDRRPPVAAWASLPAALREPPWAAQDEDYDDYPDEWSRPSPAPLFADLPEVPDWLATAALPPIRTRLGGEVLPQQAVAQLVRWIQAGSRTAPRPSPQARAALESALDEIEGFCDPVSLAEFFTALAVHIDTARRPQELLWVLNGLGRFGDDASARRYTWWLQRNLELRPAEAHRHGLPLSAEPLARMDTPYSRLCQEAVWEWSGLGRRAGRLAHRLAAERLETCRLPGVGGDPDSGSVLDFGPRGTLTMFFTGPNLDRRLQDAQGRVLEGVPWPPRPHDEQARATQSRFSGLDAGSHLLAQTVARRLERAMISGRKWPLPLFAEQYVDNRLLRHIAAAVLWRAEAAGEVVYFRVAEDGALVDADGARIALPADASVKVAHRLRLSGAELAQWTPLFHGPGIIEPFSQLGRSVHGLGADAEDWRVQRTVGATLRLSFVNSLIRRGWSYGHPDRRDGRTRRSVHRVLDAAHTVVLELSPFAPDDPRTTELTAGVLALAAPPRPGHAVVEPRPARHFAELDEVVLSELLRELTGLARF
ncbi:MAG TPA: DUF4132 domain-containing protein [Actinocrinis sp.]|nr:DUF4132 domain-containing protein [Actinocrinis sp.]